MAAFRRPVRSRPIRLLLVGMFVVPLVSLLALWILATLLTVPRAIDDHFYESNSAALDSTAVETVSFELPTERLQTYLWLLSGGTASKKALLDTRAAVNQALPAALAAFEANEKNLSPTATALENQLVASLRQLPSIRAAVDSGSMNASEAFTAYNNVIDAQYQAYDSSINQRGSVLVAESIGAVQSAYVLEMASREVALADGAFEVEKGRMSPAVHQLFISSAASRVQLLNLTLALLPPTLRANYLATTGSPVAKQFQALEQQIANATDSRPLPVSAKTWETVSAAYLTALQKTEVANGGQLQALSSSASDGFLTEAILAGGVGLAAVVVSVALMLWFGRRVTGDLTRLHGSVREMAEERLPRVVEQLRRGDDVDVAAESPSPDAEAATVKEIAQIGQSFGVVQQAAVAAAVDQARLRKGVNQVFLNISMRNQSLLHRQLTMLDAMERRTGEPDALADLFRLDHLTTRMRRHAEGLIILSGATPGRRWRDPVPVVDVLRAAVAEVEDYVRVDVTSESTDLVAGNAVNDVIHLIAELVENATVFSPPNTRIEVRADRAGAGVVAEIEDRGLGLSDAELASINYRLAQPPEFDLADSEQLGLFVVSRLAARHAIKVALRQSVFGGTTAILVLPFGVIVRAEEADSFGARAGSTAGAGSTTGGYPLNGGSGPDGAESRPDTGGSGAVSVAAMPAPSASSPGRHRLAATGRLAPSARPETADPETPGLPDWQSRPVPPRPLPRPPWEEARPAPPPAAAPPRPGPPGPGSHLGMPIRVPQANMAPQLQSQRDGGAKDTAPREPRVDERPPEATRSLMDMMQQGWERGRVDDLDDPAGAPDDGTERERGWSNGTD